MHDDAMNERDELDSQDELDLQIGAALATYSDAEAEPGLAYRILAATSQRQSRRPALRWLAVAVPALASILLVAMLARRHTNSPSETRHVVARIPSSTSEPALVVGPGKAGHPARRRAVTAGTNRATLSALPRLEVFPAPTPLTAEEQALLGVANHRSEEVRAQVVTAQTAQAETQDPVEPIRIAAIHIPPLNPPDKGNN